MCVLCVCVCLQCSYICIIPQTTQDQPHVNQDTRLDNRIIDLRVSLDDLVWHT